MSVRALSLFIVSVFAFSGVLLADPTLPETIRHPKAKCIVERSGGEYSFFIVKF